MGSSNHIRATASSQAAYRSPRPRAAGLIHFAARPSKNIAALSLRASSTTSALRCAAVFLLTGIFAPALRGWNDGASGVAWSVRLRRDISIRVIPSEARDLRSEVTASDHEIPRFTRNVSQTQRKKVGASRKAPTAKPTDRGSRVRAPNLNQSPAKRRSEIPRYQKHSLSRLCFWKEEQRNE